MQRPLWLDTFHTYYALGVFGVKVILLTSFNAKFWQNLTFLCETIFYIGSKSYC